ncbi:uncharacterized protein LOC107636798 [Arachis ipaensis]|uniref:uncharacterized protein LOC107636798 n=1 Tax=Arachis ipaensis TaxID=130454 RepID=UPI000A2B094A|nr:uncharacterized protein LOC107636798 [Arachis ipaensis]
MRVIENANRGFWERQELILEAIRLGILNSANIMCLVPVDITGCCCCCACDHRRLWVRHRRGWSRAEEGEETSVTAEPNAGERRSPRESSLLPSLLPPENTSAATEICRRRRCRSSGRCCRSRWLPELPPNRFSDRRCFIFLVRNRMKKR